MERKREPRGRVIPPSYTNPNVEPVWLPDPKHLEFGRHSRCPWCKGKGKKGGKICGVCSGFGVIDEGPRDHGATGEVAGGDE